MKKQKKPIVLVLLLAALFGGIVFMNKPASASNEPPTPEVKPEDKTALANDVAANMKDDKKADKKGDAKAGKPDEKKEKDPAKEMVEKARKIKPGGDGPSILKPNMGAPMKPKPNDSSISTQWYKDEAAKSHDKSN